ncbi:hypothetical protein PC120_g14354 [Phytophthora cactorum]|nr:hypothetical protein PC120_g14354 [Phytophthora cactorum]
MREAGSGDARAGCGCVVCDVEGVFVHLGACFLAQLLEVTAADFLETFSPALSEQNSVAIPAEHELTEFPDWAHFLSTSEVVFDQAITLETACHATEYDALSAAERSAQERSARERVTMGLMGTVIAPETDKAI